MTGDCHRIGTNLNVNAIGDGYDCFTMGQPSHGNIRECSLIEIWNADRPDD
ncbi:SPASM domain-containing protein [Lonsdalea quercina]|uniref:SPASM domain-containing protein n=1 Tax=Lonsdalea quercina TaxID=71657 RepID=UPI0039747861